jgi:hypothetical protein
MIDRKAGSIRFMDYHSKSFPFVPDMSNALHIFSSALKYQVIEEIWSYITVLQTNVFQICFTLLTPYTGCFLRHCFIVLYILFIVTFKMIS